MKNKLKVNRRIKMISLFSGIGAFEKSLTRIGANYELVNYCEIDKYASKSYSLIHNESEDKNLWDITKIDIESLPVDIDLITHGSPCQDFSLAGSQSGGDEGSNTKSSLMWNSVEIIKHCRPKYVIWENVKNIVSKKHKHNFEQYLDTLEGFGYKNYYKILNAKDYGIPQNRERVFVVSILGDDMFKFPKHIRELQDIQCFLEKNVVGYDVIQPSMIKNIGGKLRIIEKFCWAITTKQVRCPNAGIIKTFSGYRYLTPKECWRLMGFDDKDIEICINNAMSNTQLYKQAGNSVVINILDEIFKILLNRG